MADFNHAEKANNNDLMMSTHYYEYICIFRDHVMSSNFKCNTRPSKIRLILFNFLKLH